MKYPTSPTPSSSINTLNISRNVSPLPMPHNSYRPDCASSKSYKFIRRIFKFDHMDFEFASWQMLYLFIAPQKVFKNAKYRKQTKSQFARDDPAFLVLLVLSLCISSLGFAFVMGLGATKTFLFILYVIFVDCLLMGLVTATVLWLLMNRFFRANQFEAEVEWGFALDIHMNAFFPPVLLLHFFQMFFYRGLIDHDWFMSRLFGNAFWLLAVCYYVYITFLGYNCVPFLKNVRRILTLLPITCFFFLFTLIIDWNLSVSLMNYYHYRVL